MNQQLLSTLAGLVFTCLLSLTAGAQFTHKIKADSVRVYNDNCDAELILENATRNISGFLFNRGNGRTEFKKILHRVNDSLFVIGGDTMLLRTSLHASGPFLPLVAGTGNPLSGTLYFGGSRMGFGWNYSGTEETFGMIRSNSNANNFYLGIASAGGALFTGSSAYASSVGNTENRAFEIATNNVVRYSVSGAGDHDFKSGSLAIGGVINTSAGGGIFNSMYYGGGGNWINLQNSGGVFYVGKNDNASTSFNGTPLASIIYSTGNAPIEIATNSTPRYSISGSGNHDFKTGTALFGGRYHAVKSAA
jgi:hypothetical protein